MNAKGKILIIDDNEDVLFALNLLLDPYVEKIKVTTQPTRIELFMTTFQPDVILLDMLLVAETGMALLNEMRGYTDLARLPEVVCTNNPVITQEVLKPFGVRALLDKSTMEPADVVVALRGALA